MQIEFYEGWEPILVNAGYCFAYADGLNRFYVSQEHQELLAAFKYPSNTFDEFRVFGQQAAEVCAMQAETRVNDLIKSSSWRISAPWRWLTIQLRQLRPHALKSKLKPLFQHLALYVSRRAWLKRIVLGALAHLSPPLRDKLEMVVSANNSLVCHMPTEMANLTPRARQIYTNLKSALARVQQDKL